jgi:porin
MLLGALASAVLATPQAARAGGEIVDHLASSPRLLGDPGGLRSELDRLGIELQLFYNQYLGWKPRGGVEPRDTKGHSGSYDLFALVDVEELAGWPGLDFLLHVKGQYDRNVNPDVGALSDPIDDADFDEPIYVDELWLEQAFFSDRASLRAGFLEQQTVYDRNAYANSEDRQFLSSFLDNNAVVPLPNGLGAVVLARPLPWLELATGAADADNVPRHAGFDTAFDSWDSLTGYLELTLRARLPSAAGGLPGSYRLGMFVDGREKTVFGRRDPVTGRPEQERGHLGAWASFDQLVLRERPRSDQGLGLFARFGRADPDTNRIEWFWSFGLQYRGLLPGRDFDVLGAAVYEAIGSGRYRDEVNPDFERETGLEIYYQVALLPWLAVTPDFQYIIDPGAAGDSRNAVVAVLRLRMTF